MQNTIYPGTVFCESSNAGSIVKETFPRSRKRLLTRFSKSRNQQVQILDMLCAMRSSENADKDNVEGRLQTDACELGFHRMTYTDIINDATKLKGEEEGGENENEEEG
jgi:hypothetical protein